jgi:hypothetical protein
VLNSPSPPSGGLEDYRNSLDDPNFIRGQCAGRFPPSPGRDARYHTGRHDQTLPSHYFCGCAVPSSMTTFSCEEDLPSLKVTRDLIGSLERYLVQRVVDECDLSLDEVKKAFTLRVEDNFGTEHFSSAEQLHTTLFPDSTKRVIVEIEPRWKREGIRLQLRLSFSRGRMLSTLSISATAPNSRELVTGLKDGVLRVLEPQKTWHWICHPGAEVWGGLIGVSMVVLFALWKLDSTHPASGAEFLFLGFLMLWMLILALPRFRPYTAFDSRAYERSTKIWNWLFAGFMSFLIFGTLLALFRKSWLGF